MKNLFPFSKVKKNSKVILYGAGEAGYDFYRQLMTSQYCKALLWVDRQWKWFQHLNLPVVSPENIKTFQFDVIVVTAEQRSTADSICGDLLYMGVERGKILWCDNYRIGYNIAAGYDADRVRCESEEAYEISPYELLSTMRLDIVVRYLYAKVLLSQKCLLNEKALLSVSYQKYELWYKKMMLIQNNGVEPTDYFMSAYFSEYKSKAGWEDFKSSYWALLNSMTLHGFDKEHFVPLDQDGKIINGAHRIAAALALDTKVWVRKYPYKSYGLCFDIDWFIKMDFSQDAIDEIGYTLKALIKEE